MWVKAKSCKASLLHEGRQPGVQVGQAEKEEGEKAAAYEDGGQDEEVGGPGDQARL